MRYTTITSASNPHIREAIAVKEKRRRYGYETFLIEGPHLVEMALQSGTIVKTVFFAEDYTSIKDGMHLLRQIAKTGAEMFQINRQILSKISDTETPQGVVAIATYSPHSLETIPLKESPLVVVIDGIQDPGNIGTIIRTSDAAGSDAVVILPGTCDVFMPKALRSTAGSIFNIPIVYSDADTLIKKLRGKSIPLFVTDVDASMTIYQADLSNPLALVFGNEAHGATGKLKEKAKALLKIPIFGRAESLNVSTSAAVCIYEAVRQRMAKKEMKK